jgi:maltooligosyltrehalose trehalohydrolase
MQARHYRVQQRHTSDLRQHRRLPVGADVLPSGGVHFRVWASRRQQVEVVLEGGPGYRPGAELVSVILEPEGDGYFSGLVLEARAGTLYRYRLDGGAESYPDAASRFQPHGSHGPSQVIDPGAFQWHDQGWRGVALEGQVIYEMHLGTFTHAGTWEAAIDELPALADLGVTILEIMPLADFPGRFDWGYDGVNLFAPTRLYGTPDDCRRFIDQAHALGF